MAGAGYKLFATGDVLTASDLNTYIQQQVVMVFASSAARTTALSGVVAEGMITYLKDTNATEYYDGAAWVSLGSTGDITGVTAGTGISGGGTSGDVTITNSMATAITTAGDLIRGTGSGTFSRLGIGSTGQVLTVAAGAPSWATPAGGGGMTLLSTTALSGTAVTVSSISGSYKSLFIYVSSHYFNTAAETVYKVNGQAAQYYGTGFYGGGAAFTSFVSSNTGYARILGTTTGTTSANSAQCNITIPMYTDAQAARNTKIMSATGYNESNGAASATWYGADDTASWSAITSFTLTTLAGTSTFSAGNLYIYGVS